MAVLPVTPFNSQTHLWRSSNPDTYFHPSFESMTATMSHHYSTTPPYGAEMDMRRPEFSSPFTVPSQEPSLALGGNQGLPISFQHPEGLKMPLPTTAAAPPQHVHPEMQQPTERRRNKLGYHRSSVACCHCRRRKIRCMLVGGDLDSRCINCIRLKKECTFVPVEQQQNAEAFSKSGPSSTGSNEASSSTSPGSTTSAAGNSFPAKPLLPMPALPEASSGYSPRNQYPLPAQTLPSQAVPGWLPGEAQRPASSRSPVLNTSWKPFMSGPANSTQFSSFGQPTPTSATWAPNTESPLAAREEMGWPNYPPQNRSMSYSGESFPGHHPTPYSSMHPERQFDRRSSAVSDVYPSLGGVPVSGIDTGHVSSMDQSAPVSAGAGPPPSFEGWNQGQQEQPGIAYPKNDVYGQWSYGAPGQG